MNVRFAGRKFSAGGSIINWIYENDYDNKVRYTLGKITDSAKPTCYCFGINPSTAEPDNLDNTLKSVDRIAKHNGFDNWIMLNVYPDRSTDPNGLLQHINSEIHKKNVEAVTAQIKALPQDEIVIWAAWGTIIKKREYLIPCIVDIYDAISEIDNIRWVATKVTKDGHPWHPLYQRADSVFEDFDMAGYLSKYKVRERAYK